MSTPSFLRRFPLLMALLAPLAAWSADEPVKAGKPAVQAASGTKAKAVEKTGASDDCPKGADVKTGSTGPSTKGETGTQGGAVLGPKKPKCPQDISGKAAKQG